MMRATTILIADDHPVVRAGLTEFVKSAGCRVVGEAADGSAAVTKFLALKPDVILMDARMPKKSGLEALDAIKRRFPNQPVIILSAFNDRSRIEDAVRFGASDYILKTVSQEDLARAIKRAIDGGPLPEMSLMRTIRRASSPQDKPLDDCPLTDRERQVLGHIVTGRTNNEIGESLGVSVETIKEHVSNLLRKLDVEDRTQAAVLAIRNDWV